MALVSTGLEFPAKILIVSFAPSALRALSLMRTVTSRWMRCGTAKMANLGGKDSNLRMPDPKSGALPTWRPPTPRPAPVGLIARPAERCQSPVDSTPGRR